MNNNLRGLNIAKMAYGHFLRTARISAEFGRVKTRVCIPQSEAGNAYVLVEHPEFVQRYPVRKSWS